MNDPILSLAMARAPYEVTVDLETRTVAHEAGPMAGFEMDDFRRTCLMEGLDRIGLTLRYHAEIDAYERSRRGGAAS